MPTLYLICGLPGAGKTTLAKQLERELPALRLSPDEWIEAIYGPEVDQATFDSARDPVEAALWNLAARTLCLGLDVILEFGFWGREERDSFRNRANALGARVELRFVDAPPEELWRRIEKRNADLPPSFRNHRHQLTEWLAVFQPPEPDEFE